MRARYCSTIPRQVTVPASSARWMSAIVVSSTRKGSAARRIVAQPASAAKPMTAAVHTVHGCPFISGLRYSGRFATAAAGGKNAPASRPRQARAASRGRSGDPHSPRRGPEHIHWMRPRPFSLHAASGVPCRQPPGQRRPSFRRTTPMSSLRLPARPALAPSIAVMSSSTRRRRVAVSLRLTLPAFLALGASVAGAQPQPRENQANWALANRFTTEALRSVVYSTSVTPRWIGEKDSLWYNWRDSKGSAFYLVVPRTKTRQHLFDHTKMAAALSAAHRRAYDPQNLPFTIITFTDDWKAIRFDVDSTRYEWTLASEALKSLGRAPRDSTAGGRGGRGGGGGGGQGGGGGANQDFRNYSPDSTAFVFAKDHNLYLVEVGKPDTVQLSKDGVRFYSFGSRDTTAITRQQEDEDDREQQQGGRGGQAQSRNRDPRVRAQATWSPDSRAFFVQRQDTRKV